MGLSAELLDEGDNEANIFITLESLIRLIERRIPYPNRRVYFDSGMVVINVWRNKQ